MNGGWRVTDKGRSVLEIMEARPAPAQAAELPPVRAVKEPTLATTLSPMPSIAPVRRKQERKRRQRDAVAAKTSERVVRNVGWGLTSSLGLRIGR
jgi:hypothetical protein